MAGPGIDHATVGPLALLAFACEIAMLVLLAVAGWGLGDAVVVQVALAVALPVAAGVVWGIWMAPTSAHRLRHPARLAVQVALFVATAVVASMAGHLWWGVAFALVASTTFAARRGA